MSIRTALAALLLVTATAACGGPSAGQGVTLRGKVYVSSSVTDQGKPRAVVEGTRVELRFTDDGRLIANAGCNQMQGPVSLDDGRISVAELGVTAMGCPKPELHEQDDWLAGVIEAKPTWKLDGTTLVVTGANAEIVLAPEQPATLEGTWTVDGLVTNDAVSSVPEGARATVVFANGTIAIDTGCNMNGAAVPYQLEGKTMKVTLGPTTRKSCGPGDEVETAVVQTFEGGATGFAIDRSTLSLTNASGTGLKLRK
ncbi:META domain-containing protein [Lentzea sp. NPDC003310]|uniref:META domain-containing protein n=1 Tax=Lentzea sp. NPDC003310 TaxID=3154447 RepID=UPI0033A5079A